MCVHNAVLQSAVTRGVVASSERREKASKGRSYQEFLIDSAGPSSASATSSADKESSIGARRAKFSSTVKELTLERTTVCMDDPSSFTQRAMVRFKCYASLFLFFFLDAL